MNALRRDYAEVYAQIPPEGMRKSDLAELAGYRSNRGDEVLALFEKQGLLLFESEGKVYPFVSDYCPVCERVTVQVYDCRMCIDCGVGR